MARAARIVPGSRAELPVEQFITYRLHALHTALNRQAIDILGRASGLGLPEWRVVSRLGRGDTPTASQIGEATSIDKGLLSRTLAVLDQRGLVAMSRDLRDRRLVRIKLTAKGKAIYERTIPHMRSRHRALMGILTKAEQVAVYSIIDKLLIATVRPDEK